MKGISDLWKEGEHEGLRDEMKAQGQEMKKAEHLPNNKSYAGPWYGQPLPCLGTSPIVIRYRGLNLPNLVVIDEAWCSSLFHPLTMSESHQHTPFPSVNRRPSK
jgi:hypothetical protein